MGVRAPSSLGCCYALNTSVRGSSEFSSVHRKVTCRDKKNSLLGEPRLYLWAILKFCCGIIQIGHPPIYSYTVYLLVLQSVILVLSDPCLPRVRLLLASMPQLSGNISIKKYFCGTQSALSIKSPYQILWYHLAFGSRKLVVLALVWSCLVYLPTKWTITSSNLIALCDIVQ